MKTINHINFEGKRFNLGGRGAFDNRLLYIDAASGDEIELYPALVTHCDAEFALASVERSPALSVVQADHHALQEASYGLRVGDEVLIGDIQFRGGRKPRAQAVWMITPVGSSGSNEGVNGAAPAVGHDHGNSADRLRGRIVNVAASGAYGFISTDSGTNLFVHATDLRGVSLVRGQEVTYELGENNRGPLAKHVRPA